MNAAAFHPASHSAIKLAICGPPIQTNTEAIFVVGCGNCTTKKAVSEPSRIILSQSSTSFCLRRRLSGRIRKKVFPPRHRQFPALWRHQPHRRQKSLWKDYWRVVLAPQKVESLHRPPARLPATRSNHCQILFRTVLPELYLSPDRSLWVRRSTDAGVRRPIQHRVIHPQLSDFRRRNMDVGPQRDQPICCCPRYRQTIADTWRKRSPTRLEDHIHLGREEFANGP
jgi:hypothetical protein